ncbi:hypothetical protein XcvCFBP7113P_19160 [Xanthomonas citri pv. vignicola]|nr:hypothetical protein XcvCFBP7113P_19160 [Xanthomonas citri pv. vignicola]
MAATEGQHYRWSYRANHRTCSARGKIDRRPGSVNNLSSTLQVGVDGASGPQRMRERTEHQPRPPGDARTRCIRRSRRCSASPR